MENSLINTYKGYFYQHCFCCLAMFNYHQSTHFVVAYWPLGLGLLVKPCNLRVCSSQGLGFESWSIQSYALTLNSPLLVDGGIDFFILIGLMAGYHVVYPNKTIHEMSSRIITCARVVCSIIDSIVMCRWICKVMLLAISKRIFLRYR